MDLVVGVDLATAAVRAVAADAEGGIHGESRVGRPPPYSPRPGWVEQDTASWRPAVEGALRKLTGALGRRAERVVGVSAPAGASCGSTARSCSGPATHP